MVIALLRYISRWNADGRNFRILSHLFFVLEILGRRPSHPFLIQRLNKSILKYSCDIRSSKYCNLSGGRRVNASQVQRLLRNGVSCVNVYRFEHACMVVPGRMTARQFASEHGLPAADGWTSSAFGPFCVILRGWRCVRFLGLLHFRQRWDCWPLRQLQLAEIVTKMRNAKRRACWRK